MASSSTNESEKRPAEGFIPQKIEPARQPVRDIKGPKVQLDQNGDPTTGKIKIKSR